MIGEAQIHDMGDMNIMATTYEEILELFRETDRKFQETSQELSRELQETSRMVQTQAKSIKALDELFTSQWGKLMESAGRGRFGQFSRPQWRRCRGGGDSASILNRADFQPRAW